MNYDEPDVMPEEPVDHGEQQAPEEQQPEVKLIPLHFKSHPLMTWGIVFTMLGNGDWEGKAAKPVSSGDAVSFDREAADGKTYEVRVEVYFREKPARCGFAG